MTGGRTRGRGELARLVRRFWRLGFCDAEIADRVSPPVHRSAVSRCRRALGLPPAVPRAERNGWGGKASWVSRRRSQARDAAGRFAGVELVTAAGG